MEKKELVFVGNANIKEMNGSTFGNLSINLENIAIGLGFDYTALKRLIAKDFDATEKQFKVPHLHAWVSQISGKSGITLRLKIGQSKQADKYITHWIALDDYVPNQTKEITPEVKQAEEIDDDLPF